jgi:hypothetical protein
MQGESVVEVSCACLRPSPQDVDVAEVSIGMVVDVLIYGSWRPAIVASVVSGPSGSQQQEAVHGQVQSQHVQAQQGNAWVLECGESSCSA